MHISAPSNQKKMRRSTLCWYMVYALVLGAGTWCMAAPKENEKKHFVLVHGVCHGAWCWYKLIPQLNSAGHRVTALDLSASGINTKKIEDVHSMSEYSQPLLELISSLPSHEKVVLVGHSLGGLSLALAMEKFPHKILVAVFLTAYMPDTVHQPSYVIDQDFTPQDPSSDTQYGRFGSTEQPLTSLLFGPNDLSSTLYQLSPIEDLELAKTLIRPGSLFQEDLAKEKKFSDKAYGSVPKVFVVCDEDKAISVEFQRWMIKNGGVTDVVEIHGADHMAMLSKPQEVCDCLIKIAHKYA